MPHHASQGRLGVEGMSDFHRVFSFLFLLPNPEYPMQIIFQEKIEVSVKENRKRGKVYPIFIKIFRLRSNRTILGSEKGKFVERILAIAPMGIFEIRTLHQDQANPYNPIP
jgi:hypothetical protein